jgi:hypothetical protein
MRTPLRTPCEHQPEDSLGFEIRAGTIQTNYRRCSLQKVFSVLSRRCSLQKVFSPEGVLSRRCSLQKVFSPEGVLSRRCSLQKVFSPVSLQKVFSPEGVLSRRCSLQKVFSPEGVLIFRLWLFRVPRVRPGPSGFRPRRVSTTSPLHFPRRQSTRKSGTEMYLCFWKPISLYVPYFHFTSLFTTYCIYYIYISTFI